MPNDPKPKREKTQKAYYMPRTLIATVANIAEQEDRSQSWVAIRLMKEALENRGVEVQTA